MQPYCGDVGYFAMVFLMNISQYCQSRWTILFLSPPTASDGVLSAGECHAASKGSAGTEDQNDPGQHPAAAGWAETHPGAAAESPGTGHTGKTKDFIV